MLPQVEKGKKEKHEEQVQFAAYKQFCDDTTVEKQRAIKEATAKMEQLVAAIQKAEADAATLAKEIAQLDEDISVYEGDKKAATEVNRSFFLPSFSPGEGPFTGFKTSHPGVSRSPISVRDWYHFFVSPDLSFTYSAPLFRQSQPTFLASVPDLPGEVLLRQPKPRS